MDLNLGDVPRNPLLSRPCSNIKYTYQIKQLFKMLQLTTTCPPTPFVWPASKGSIHFQVNVHVYTNICHVCVTYACMSCEASEPSTRYANLAHSLSNPTKETKKFLCHLTIWESSRVSLNERVGFSLISGHMARKILFRFDNHWKKSSSCCVRLTRSASII